MRKTLNIWLALVLVLVLAIAMGGCKGLKGPSWLHPGPAPDQQKRAERFDPYVDNQIAPEVVGGRPREYANPVPEPERARWPVPGVRQ